MGKQRPIKFRSYQVPTSKRPGKMLYGHDMTIDQCWCFRIDDDADDKDPVMQFTGLLNKNGTDIYEGDILRFNTVMRNGLRTMLWAALRKELLWNR